MGRLVAGCVVVVLFPFTDLSSAKVRPAVVVAIFRAMTSCCAR